MDDKEITRCEWCNIAIMPLEPYLFIVPYGKTKHTICLECYLHLKDGQSKLNAMQMTVQKLTDSISEFLSEWNDDAKRLMGKPAKKKKED